MPDYIWNIVSILKAIAGIGTGYGGYLLYKHLEDRKKPKITHNISLENAKRNEQLGDQKAAIKLYKQALMQIDYDLTRNERYDNRLILIDKREYVLSRLDKLGEIDFASIEIKKTLELRQALHRS